MRNKSGQAWIVLQASVLCTAFGVATVRAESVPDSFGNEDPFAVLNATPLRIDSLPGAESKPMQIKTEGSVYLKNTLSNVNQDTRADPGSRKQQLKENLTVLETRLTLSDTLDTAKQWRWLFRGFNAASNNRESNGRLRDEARIDELFIDRKSAQWFASAGKRRINWGHAQGFNPVNVVVPPRDPLDPSRETDGQPMLWINRAGSGQSLDLVVTRNYDRDYNSDQNRWGLKWSISAGKSDYALYAFNGERYRDENGLKLMERMLGGSFSADVFPGMTLYMETARFDENERNYYDDASMPVRKNNAYWQVVVGSGINLGGRSRVSLEYFRNEQGYSKSERINYFRAADIPLANTSIAADYRVAGMNRNYLLVSYQDEFRENYTLDLSALVPGDQSYSLRVQGQYAISDSYELRAVFVHNQGTRDSEFGNALVSNALELGISVGF